MTDLELISKCINTLDDISVPAKYVEQIAIPVAQVSGALKELYNGIVAKIRENEKKQEEGLKLVPVEDEPENNVPAEPVPKAVEAEGIEEVESNETLEPGV